MISSWGRVVSVQFHTVETNIEKKAMTRYGHDRLVLVLTCGRCWPAGRCAGACTRCPPARSSPSGSRPRCSAPATIMYEYIYFVFSWTFTSLLYSSMIFLPCLGLVYLICENNMTLSLFSCNPFILFLSINFMEILQWKCAALVGGRSAIDFRFYRKLFPGSWVSVDCLLTALILSTFNVSLTNI